MRSILLVLGVVAFVLPAPADEVLWDNGDYDEVTLVSSQHDQCYPFVSQTADDFIIDCPPGQHFEVRGIHFTGGFWPGDGPNPGVFNFYVYNDDGGKPTGSGMDDPAPTAVWALEDVELLGTKIGNAIYDYDIAFVDTPFAGHSGERYWLAIQGDLCYPPNWGWGTSTGASDLPMMMGYPLIQVPFWSLTDYYGVAFKLTGECIPEPASLSLLAVAASVLVRRR